MTQKEQSQKGRSYKPPFKAIETHYDNYKFRSRLEARHALFFNTLGIPYIYEMEGFNLDGTWYLPDFYLPQQDCYVEIKGVEPTPEEFRKAYDLAFYSLKKVYIFCGEVGIDKHGYSAFAFYPLDLRYWNAKGEKQTKPVSPEVLWTLETLKQAAIQITLDEDRSDFALKQEEIWTSKNKWHRSWDDMYDTICITSNYAIEVANLLRGNHDQILSFLREASGGWDITSVELCDCNAWGECPNCSKLVIAHTYLTPYVAQQKPCTCDVLANTNAPRILDAYRTAREARFQR